MKKLLTFEKDPTGSYYKVFFKDKLYFWLMKDHDGYFYCQCEITKSGGVYNEETLREIVDKLEELNKPITESINNYFNNKNQKT